MTAEKLTLVLQSVDRLGLLKTRYNLVVIYRDDLEIILRHYQVSGYADQSQVCYELAKRGVMVL